uniref:NB-ARC domain-containing protein n=1 Tax=Oryza punctata TaxID=4537 RepID=A0A0E0JKF6_ORYPU
MSLVVVELVNDDIGDETWRRFCSSIDTGCRKIIIISRAETTSRLGTTQALKLKRLRRHEFRSNPEEHQELILILRRIATQIKGAFIAATMFARLLRANLNVKFWCYTLEFIRKAMELQLFVCGEHSWNISSDSLHGAITICLTTLMALSICAIVGTKTISACSMKDELRKITTDDVLNKTSAFSEGNFEFLRWKSPIPPITAT